MRTALIATVILLGPLAACGNDTVRAADPAAGSTTAGSPTAGAEAAGSVTSRSEKATPAGLAAAVIRHLDGWEVVEASGGLTDMEDTRELSVDLRLGNADGRHNRLSIQDQRNALSAPERLLLWVADSFGIGSFRLVANEQDA